MEILQQLGANSTAIIQFFIFAISITFLTVVVFGPYFKAYDQRLLNTKGADNVAKDTVEETKNLNLIFQSKAREVNDKIKSVYDQSKSQAQEHTDALIKAAKSDSETILKNSRAEISSQLGQSKSQVDSLSKEIAQQLTQKFEGGL